MGVTKDEINRFLDVHDGGSKGDEKREELKKKKKA